MATPAHSINLLDEARKPFLEVADKISDAVVYLDAPFGEAAYYNLGLSFLYGLGAQAVCALEDASANDEVAASIGGSKSLERLTIFTGRLLNDSHRHILRALRAHRNVRRCTIFCAVSEAAHADYPGGLLSLDAYSQYEQLLREDLEKQPRPSIGTVNLSAGGGTSEREHSQKAAQNRSGKEDGDGWGAWSDEETSNRGNTEQKVEGGFGELSQALHEARRSQQGEDTWDDAGSGDEWGQQQDTGEKSGGLEISVRFFPGLYCAVAPGAFVLPSSAAITQAPLSVERTDGEEGSADCLGRGIPTVGGPLGGVEALPAGVSLLAHELGEMLAQLDLRPELFSLGPTSRAIAKAMSDLPTVESRGSAGVVLVDRTLDLLTPACHVDNFLDRLVSALPQPPSDRSHLSSTAQTRGASTSVWREPLDFRVPLGDVFPSSSLMGDGRTEGTNRRESEIGGRIGVTSGELPSTSHAAGVNSLDAGHLLGGALFQPSDAQATERMDAFLTRRNSKDALMALRRALQEAVRNEKLPAPRLKLGAIGAPEILALLAPLEAQPRLALKHRALIQLARAAAAAFDAPHGPRWEALASIEKILVLSGVEDRGSLVRQLRELVVQNRVEVQSGESSVINLRDILTLAVVAYSLAGDLAPSTRRSSPGGPVESPFAWEEELALQEAVVEAVLAGPQPATLGFVDDLDASLEALWERRREEKAGKGVDGRPGGGPGSGEKGGGAEEKRVDEGGEEEVSKARTSREGDGGEWEDTHDGWDADWGVDEDDSPRPDSDAAGATGEESAYDEVRLRLEVKDRVEEVFEKLRLVASARQRLTGFRYLDQAPGVLGATCAGLLKQLVAKICAREEVPGLEHAVSAVKKLLQTGLGRFGFQNFQSGPKPGDYKVVLVFVVGGVTLGEIKDIREALVPSQSQETPTIVIGGTTLVTPGKLYEELFDKSH